MNNKEIKRLNILSIILFWIYILLLIWIELLKCNIYLSEIGVCKIPLGYSNSDIGVCKIFNFLTITRLRVCNCIKIV